MIAKIDGNGSQIWAKIDSENAEKLIEIDMDVMLTFDNHKNKICQNIFINAVLFKKEAKHFASH